MKLLEKLKNVLKGVSRSAGANAGKCAGVGADGIATDEHTPRGVRGAKPAGVCVGKLARVKARTLVIVALAAALLCATVAFVAITVPSDRDGRSLLGSETAEAASSTTYGDWETALSKDATWKLTANVTPTSPYVVDSGHDVAVDLNGFNIMATHEVFTRYGVFRVLNGTLTIKGTGNLQGKAGLDSCGESFIHITSGGTVYLQSGVTMRYNSGRYAGAISLKTDGVKTGPQLHIGQGVTLQGNTGVYGSAIWTDGTQEKDEKHDHLRSKVYLDGGTTGIKIKENNGGGVYSAWKQADYYFKGKLDITGDAHSDLRSDGGIANYVKLNGKISEDSKIGVYNETPGIVLTSGYSTYNSDVDPRKIFIPRDSSQDVILRNGEVVLVNKLQKPTTVPLTYNGSQQTGVTNIVSGVTVTGHTGTNAGDDYEATAKISDWSKYVWEDGTQTDLKIGWSIARLGITAPTFSKNSTTYSASAQNITGVFSAYQYMVMTLPSGFKQYNNTGLTIAAGTAAGSYTLSIAPDSNHCWSTGNDKTGAKTSTFTINRLGIAYPTLSKSTAEYTTGAQSFTINSSYRSVMQIGMPSGWPAPNASTGAVTSPNGVNVGQYVMSFMLGNNHYWTGETGGSASPTVIPKMYQLTYTVTKGSLTKPTVSTLTQGWKDGTTELIFTQFTSNNKDFITASIPSSHWTPTYSTSQLKITSKSALPVGEYSMSFTPDNNHKWAGTTGAAENDVFSYVLTVTQADLEMPTITGLTGVTNGMTTTYTVPFQIPEHSMTLNHVTSANAKYMRSTWFDTRYWPTQTPGTSNTPLKSQKSLPVSTYVLQFTPDANHKWKGKTGNDANGTFIVEFTVTKMALTVPKLAAGEDAPKSFTTGTITWNVLNVPTDEIKGFMEITPPDSTWTFVSGNPNAVLTSPAGSHVMSYTIRFKPDANHKWDMTGADAPKAEDSTVEIPVIIKAEELTKPQLPANVGEYNKDAYDLTLAPYNDTIASYMADASLSDGLTLTTTASGAKVTIRAGLDVGTYKIRLTPDSDHVWKDTGKNGAYDITYTIKEAELTRPVWTQTGNTTQTGAFKTETVKLEITNINKDNYGYLVIVLPTTEWGANYQHGTNSTEISSPTSELPVGVYKVTITPDSNHVWSVDRKRTAVELTYTVTKAQLKVPGLTAAGATKITETYKAKNATTPADGIHTVTIYNYTSESNGFMRMHQMPVGWTGPVFGPQNSTITSPEAPNVGEYHMYFEPDSNHEWENATSEADKVRTVELIYEIERADITPSIISANTVVYGSTLELKHEGNLGNGTVVWTIKSKSDDGDAHIYNGILMPDHVGKVTIQLFIEQSQNYNASADDITQEITITPKPIAKPKFMGNATTSSATYNEVGHTITLVASEINAMILTMPTGTTGWTQSMTSILTPKIDADDYILTFEPDVNYEWSGETTEAGKRAKVELTFTVLRKKLNLPQFTKTSETYNGPEGVHEFRIDTPDLDHFTIVMPNDNDGNAWNLPDGDGNVITPAGLNAKQYDISFTPNKNYCWWDGNESHTVNPPAKTVPFTVNKAARFPTFSYKTITYETDALAPTYDQYFEDAGHTWSYDDTIELGRVKEGTWSETDGTFTPGHAGYISVTVTFKESTNYLKASTTNRVLIEKCGIKIDFKYLDRVVFGEYAGGLPEEIKITGDKGSGMQTWTVTTDEVTTNGVTYPQIPESERGGATIYRYSGMLRPSLAGDVYVTLNIGETENYLGNTVTKKITIDKADLGDEKEITRFTLTITTPAKDIIFKNADWEPEHSLIYTLEYTAADQVGIINLSSEDYSLSWRDNKNAGIATLRVTAKAESLNFKGFKEVKFVIIKAYLKDCKLTININADDIIYDGTEWTPWELVYKIDYTSTLGLTENDFKFCWDGDHTNAREGVTLWIEAEKDREGYVNNFQGTSPKVSFEIKKATFNTDDMHWDYLDRNGPFVYNSSQRKVQVIGLPKGCIESENVTVTYEETDEFKWRATDVGKYTARAHLHYNANNYNDISIADLEWEIQLFYVDMSGVEWDYSEPFVYDGMPHVVKLKNLPQGVEVKEYVYVTAAGEVKTELPTNAGKYIAKVASFEYDENNFSKPEFEAICEFEILKRDIKASDIHWTTESGEQFTFDGSNHAPKVWFEYNGVRYYLEVRITEDGTEFDNAWQMGNYKVSVLHGDYMENFNFVGEDTIEISVKPDMIIVITLSVAAVLILLTILNVFFFRRHNKKKAQKAEESETDHPNSDNE